ncbi:MAG: 5'-methylthioadenosine/S-adenosylhomocysteine nucleosidase [Pseudomonadota bacterium]
MQRHLRPLVLTLVALFIPVLGMAESRIALVAAYEGEYVHLRGALDGLDVSSVREINGVRFELGQVHDQAVILFESGIGLTNAAMTLQLALSEFDVQAILFSGVAGALDPQLKKGDLAIPARWHHYDFGAKFTADEKAPGGYRVPPFMQEHITEAHFGNFYPYKMTVRSEGDTQGREISYYPTDEAWLALARATAADISLQNAHGEEAAILVDGVGGSGLAFNDDAAFSLFVREHWGTGTVDMESAALAQVALANGVPILQIRAISDIVGNENPNEFAEFKHKGEANAGLFLNAMLARRAKTR